MNAHKLYKLTVEYTLVVAAETLDDAEASAKDIMTVHGDSIFKEDPTNVAVEFIPDDGALPDGWEPECLPYSKYSWYRQPEELVNKQIKEFFI
jgi:hypothetical protein